MSQDATKHRSLPLVRELVRTYQAFELLSNERIRQHGLTPPQFDVIATLGNTEGMSCKQLSEKTLITKGTLTGVLDRMLEKGLISRNVDPHDRRSLFVRLTSDGETLFAITFPDVVQHCGAAFDAFDDQTLAQHLAALRQIQLALRQKLEL